MAHPSPLLEARGLGKSFLGQTALDGVDFTLRAGEVHALLGENGAGKSTLVKVLTGVHRRDAGTILMDGAEVAPHDTAGAQALGIGTVYQEVNLLPNLSVAENIFLGRQPRRFGLVDRRAMERNTRTLLAGYGLAIDVAAPLGRFSVAVQQIVAIARAVDLSGRVLILDEPTASLDRQEVETLFAVVRRLKARGLGIIFITHFLDQVFALADRVTVLRNGRRIDTVAVADTDPMAIVQMMLGRDLEEVESGPGRPAAAAGAAPAIAFEGYGRRRSVEPFDLAIRPGEVIGIAGLLGSGRTETARLLFGLDAADSGTVRIDGRSVRIASPRHAVALGFGYCPEDRKTDGIVGDLSVRENIVLALQARRGWLRPLSRAEQAELADRFVAALDIRTTDIEKPVKLLSGGNQQKAVLARWLATEPRFLILDEPTRGIDVGAHAEIIRLINRLCDGGMSLVVISSEFDELVVCSSRIVVLRDRRHVGELAGGALTATAIMRTIAAGGADDRTEAA
ncbi:sugar ABC transporter ATP-binding protein [Azospirillum halopraeferens]|uniref:sugar ABC transporter ATP-binding protein n=1 Tax=Azospirillum halopraeferens TaxID=34010 RepID=UPI00041AFFAD|nr:sugar ABC transporter ATP-binding protein [Azospirillum halopraeferens]